MSEERVKLQIPESNSYGELQEVLVELQFDTPYALHENRDTDYEVWFYTVVDQGDWVEKSLTAYSGLHNHIQKTGGVKGSILSLGKVGSRKETQWFVKWVSGPKQEAREAVARPVATAAPAAAPAPAYGSVYTPFTEDEVEAMITLCNHHLDLYEKFYAEVVMRPALSSGMSVDQLARLATGAMISVSRQYKRGMTVDPVETVTQEAPVDDGPPF